MNILTGIAHRSLSTVPAGGGPLPGDLVRWPSGTLGRIWEVGTGHCRPNELQVCRNLGRAFMGPDHVDVSGGPFLIIGRSEIEQSIEVAASPMWTWNQFGQGRGNDVEFTVHRAVWIYTGVRRASIPVFEPMEPIYAPSPHGGRFRITDSIVGMSNRRVFSLQHQGPEDSPLYPIYDDVKGADNLEELLRFVVEPPRWFTHPNEETSTS